MRADGVDLRDPVEAIVACRTCRAFHEEAIACEPRAEVRHPPKTIRTDNGECNPYLPPQAWQGEDGG